ncbi:MAG TPA: hypothetical protein PKC91_06705 [Ignavibacteria bacterium]|nr:hypothetical protein [Ignavibacteria bacterium]
MKAQTFILTVLILLFTISFLPGNTPAAEISAGKTKNELTIKSANFNVRYERVFKDGIWYIYVYDGDKLIDVFPE